MHLKFYDSTFLCTVLGVWPRAVWPPPKSRDRPILSPTSCGLSVLHPLIWPQAPGWSFPECPINRPAAHVAFCTWLFSQMHLRFVLGSLDVSCIQRWSPCAFISVYWLLPTLKGIWAHSISWPRRCSYKRSHPSCEPGPHPIPACVPRLLGRVWELVPLFLCFFWLLQPLSQVCRGGDSPRFNLDLQDGNGVECPLVSLLFCFFEKRERFLGPWTWIRCRRRSLPPYIRCTRGFQVHILSLGFLLIPILL